MAEEGESFFFNVCVQFTITVSLKKGLEMEEEERCLNKGEGEGLKANKSSLIRTKKLV